MKSNSNIIRWGGLAAMLGGVFWVVWSNLFRAGFEAAGGPISDALLLLAALLTLAGLVGLNALQGGNYGSIGQAGFYTAAAGLLTQALGALVLLMGSEALELDSTGRVVALWSRHLASEGIAALVWVGAHRGTADRVLHE
jgi:hypothetical protein